MSVKSFKFVSPGIFVNEVDNSQLPRLPDEMGPVIIGRAERGPGMVPVKINSFSEFVETFGEPIAGAKCTPLAAQPDARIKYWRLAVGPCTCGTTPPRPAGVDGRWAMDMQKSALGAPRAAPGRVFSTRGS